MASLPSGVAALGNDSLLTFSQPELSFGVQIFQVEEGLLPVSAEMSTWSVLGTMRSCWQHGMGRG